MFSLNSNYLMWALTLFALVTGIYLRLKGLDKAPFTIDEYYIAASVQNENVRVVQRAWKPHAPVWPQKERIAGYSMLLGLLLGAGFVLVKDYAESGIRNPEEVERYLHLDVLTSVPRYDNQSSHLVVEAYQSLRTALLFERMMGLLVLAGRTAP